MSNKNLLVMLLAASALFLGGCQTAKGAKEDVTTGVKTTYENAEKADDWLQDNLW